METWQGTLDANWGTTGNWTPNSSISPGDSLAFTNASTVLTPVDNVAEAHYNIGFAANNYDLTAAGPSNAVDLIGASAIATTSAASGTNDINIPLNVLANATATVTKAGSVVSLDNTLTSDPGVIFTVSASGAGNLVVSTLSNSSNFDGTVDDQGKFEVDGILGDGPVEIDGGVLSGSGTIVGPVSATGNGGSLDPGPTFTAGSVSLNSNTNFNVQLNSLTSFSQLSATGGVNLNGAKLNVSLNYVPSSTDTWVIINPNAPVSGTFANLPQGATFVVNGVTLQINYIAGSAHDEVMLSVISPPIASPDYYSTPENTELFATTSVLNNDHDPQNLPLQPIVTSSPSHGTLAMSDDGTFTYVPATGFSGTDTFMYEATNGILTSEPTTVTIYVNPVNLPPIVNDVTYTGQENTTLTIPAPGVLASAYSPEGLALTASVVSNPSHGSLTLNTDGSFSYTPATGYTGSDSFTYIATDSNGLTSAPATATINVGAVDVAATLQDSNFGVAENGSLFVDGPGVLANATNPSGNTLFAILLTSTTHGSLTLNSSGSFTYTPNTNFAGTDTFTYEATDGTLLTNTATVTITVAPIPIAPTASDDSYSLLENQPLSIAAPGLLLNDTYPSGAPTINIVNGPLYAASFTVNDDGSFSYTPDTNYSGPDSFTYYLISDGLVSNLATVSLSIAQVPVAPIAADDNYTVNENSVLTVAAPGVLENDVDPNGLLLSAVVQTAPAHGSLTLSADGSFVYIADANYSGTDSFTYLANDAKLSSNIATVTITVDPVPVAPTAGDATFTVLENQTLSVAAPGLLLYSQNPNGGSITVKLVNGPFNDSAFSVGNDGSISYTPNTNFTGTDTFTYYLTADGLNSNVATITLNVVPVPINPIANSDAFTVNENSTLTVAAPGVLANDIDPNGLPLSAVLQIAPSHGSLTLNANGSFTYIPTANYSGTDTFSYLANDGKLNSNLATVTITVVPVAVAPTAGDDSYSVLENQTLTVGAPGLLLNATYPSGAPTINIVNGPLHAVAFSVLNNGSLVYTPATNFSGTDTFTYYLTSGGLNSNTATVTITVVPVTLAPVANNDSYSVTENLTLTVAAPGVLANDVDPNGLPLSAVLQTSPTHGTLTLNSNGSFVYVPTTNYFGTDSFTYVASNGKLISNVATVSLTIVKANLAPTVQNQSYTTTVNAALTVPTPGVLGSAFDPNGLPLTAVLVNTTLHGSLTLSPDGAFTYDPNANFIGTDSFTFRASNGVLESNLGTVTITVSASQPTTITTVHLNPLSDTGESNTDRITRDNTPNFYGTTGANLTVYLYAQLISGPGTPTVVGVTTADAAGNYSVTSAPLPDGTYAFSVAALRADGMSTGTISAGNLLIDTVSPVITSVVMIPKTGQIYVTFDDPVSGMNLGDITHASNYSFTRQSLLRPRANLISLARLVPPVPTAEGPATVVLKVANGHRMARGRYLLAILSGGIQDIAGNPLDGSYDGTFPTGNGVTGVQFDALFLNRSFKPDVPVATNRFVPILTQPYDAPHSRRFAHGSTPGGPLAHFAHRQLHKGR